MQNNNEIRLNKFLASAGIASRRKCDELIENGKIKINGKIVRDLGVKIDTNKDTVEYNGKIIKNIEKKTTIIINKPKNYVCSRKSQFDDKTIYDLIPKSFESLFYVGRLDKNSEGLLILTNDGELCNLLTHPNFKIEKEYEAILNKEISLKDIDTLLIGIQLEKGIAKAHKVNYIGKSKKQIKIILKQGMKRQIRYMLKELGYNVVKLKRTRIGNLELDNLEISKWRFLNNDEIKNIYNFCKHKL